MNTGFMKVAAAVPALKVGHCNYNTLQLIELVQEADRKGCEVVVFPELCITGYTCQDLFQQHHLLEKAQQSLAHFVHATTTCNCISIVGMPLPIDDMLFNAAVVVQAGHILGVVLKTYLPNYSEFYEQRWFSSVLHLREQTIELAGQTVEVTARPTVFKTREGVKFGIEICEDLWAPLPPSNQLCMVGAEIIFNLSASDELIGKHSYLRTLIAQQSARTFSAYIYSSCGFGESTQDVVYGGNALIYENGACLQSSSRFSTSAQLVTAEIDIDRLRSERLHNTTFAQTKRIIYNQNIQLAQQVRTVNTLPVKISAQPLERVIPKHPFIPTAENMHNSCEEIFSIQVMGLAKRLVHTQCQRVVIGVSGGLDSTLALLVCVKTFDKLGFDRKGIVGITMPGFGTTDRTYQNALQLMAFLGITQKEIAIRDSVIQHFKDIGHDMANHDVTYENSQARERTQILMDMSNALGALVIGTGDLSELALGWATYNGDHMSMYAVNSSIPKTLIKYLVQYVAKNQVDEKAAHVLSDIIDTPISPELIPADHEGKITQKTEELVGPYELHDFFLYYCLRYAYTPGKIFYLAAHAFEQTYDKKTIKFWLTTFYRRFFSQQFKRSCLPDGPKVGSVSLSPRGDWRMPSDAAVNLWLDECELLSIEE